MMRRLNHGTVELVIGDIVAQNTDAIVNAANSNLTGGGGVDGAIHRAAGPNLKQLCLQIPVDAMGRRCETGHVKTTAGCHLQSKHVIHAVGPIYDAYGAEEAQRLLRQVHQNALQAAVEHHCQSVAFPAISTGAYRFPMAEAAGIAVDSVCSFLNQPTGLNLVRFVLFQQAQLDFFQAALEDWSADR